MADEKDCVVVEGKTKDESKCVSNICKNTEDCKKIFNRDWQEYECKNGTCVEEEDYDDEDDTIDYYDSAYDEGGDFIEE